MYFRRSDDLIFIYYRDLISLSKPENTFKIILYHWPLLVPAQMEMLLRETKSFNNGFQWFSILVIPYKIVSIILSTKNLKYFLLQHLAMYQKLLLKCSNYFQYNIIDLKRCCWYKLKAFLSSFVCPAMDSHSKISA